MEEKKDKHYEVKRLKEEEGEEGEVFKEAGQYSGGSSNFEYSSGFISRLSQQ